ncbi:MAG: sensor histidine kinase [Actinomycetota bacterium]|nr:sensor histidine kinase [Actinomycetota bacterium]
MPLILVGLLASRSSESRVASLLTLALEGALAGAAVATTGSGDSPFLPYIIAPAFTGGLRSGLLAGIQGVGSGAAILLLAPVVLKDSPSPRNLTSDLAQWVVLAAVVGVVASWVRAVVLEANRAPDMNAVQEEAFRLLTELRSVARQLPGTLDPESGGEAMLDRARSVCRYDTGAVLVSLAGSQKLTLVCKRGADRPHWDLSLQEDSAFAEAWFTQRGQVFARRLPRTDKPSLGGSSIVVPLISGARTFGLVVLESGVAHAFASDAAERVAAAVEGLAMQLQTGLVFDEVRELATHEERRRLAREIHDGIAQELASLAYALDNAAADIAAGNHVGAQVDGIRKEVRRLVTDLRMSLFDLRAEVDPDEGLGAAIGRHVRAVGTASGMTVHLSLNEAAVRLGAEAEAELLRIVQEAVTNARKHSAAKNLWVTCSVDPPTASITIEDDGRGVTGQVAADSHGIAIMRERAARVRAELTVEPRLPHGTRVRVSLGMVRT